MISGQPIVIAKRGDLFNDEIEIKLGVRTPGGSLAVAAPVVFVQVPPDEPPPSGSMLSLPPEAAKALMDALWNLGIRPSDIGTPGHLAATQKHLEDMRAIAFHQIDVPKP